MAMAMETISQQDAANFARSYAEDHDAECLCTICSCGAHRCPPDVVQGRYNGIKSEQQAAYTGAYLPVTRKTKEAYVYAPRAFEGSTTNQDDYQYWANVQPRKPSGLARKTNDVFGSNLKFEGTTTNKHDFRKWKASPAQSNKPAGELHYTPDNRDFKTEVGDQFDYKHIKPRESCKPSSTTISSNLKFEAVTTHQADFTKKERIQSKSVQRKARYVPRKETRQFQTESSGQYTEKTGEQCPARALYSKTKTTNGHVKVENDGRTWRLTQPIGSSVC
jgi:hypothetical protein